MFKINKRVHLPVQGPVLGLRLIAAQLIRVLRGLWEPPPG